MEMENILRKIKVNGGNQNKNKGCSYLKPQKTGRILSKTV